MRKLAAIVVAAALLSGCMSTLQKNTYDERAREECDQEPGTNRVDCYDRVERNSREREW
jgi:hypothetical protein